MNEKRILPHFESEAEEAQWWFENQEQFDAAFEQALEDGSLGRGTVMKRALALDDSVVPEASDVKEARLVAQKRGLPYHDFVKMLIHAGLKRERGHGA